MLLGAFSGLNNVLPPEALTPTGRSDEAQVYPLTDAVNIDIDDSGKIRRRRGFTLAVAGDCHSLWGDGDYLLTVANGNLCSINPDLSLNVLRSNVGAGTLAYQLVDGVVYARSSTDAFIVDGSTVHDWGVPHVAGFSTSAITGSLPAGDYAIALTYVRTLDGLEGGCSQLHKVTLPTDGGGIRVSNIAQVSGYTVNVYLTNPDGDVAYFAKAANGTSVDLTEPSRFLQMPLRTLGIYPPIGDGPFCIYNGRAYVIDGGVVWVTDPFQYENLKVASSYLMFDDEARCIAAVGDGIYIGTINSVFFMAGDYPQMKLTKVARYGAFVMVEADATTLGADNAAEAIIVSTDRGICYGFSSGQFINATEQRVSLPTPDAVVGVQRQQDGINQFIGVCTHVGEPVSESRAGEFVSGDIRRFV